MKDSILGKTSAEEDGFRRNRSLSFSLDGFDQVALRKLFVSGSEA